MNPTRCPHPLSRRGVWLLFAALIVSCGLARAATATPADTPDYSAAERLLFMSGNLAGLALPATLRYGLRKSGSLEAAFQDQVGGAIDAQADGRCCNGRGEFLSGARRAMMSAIAPAQAQDTATPSETVRVRSTSATPATA